MAARFLTFVIILLLLLFAIDTYTFKGIRLLTASLEREWLRKLVHWSYWITSIGLYLMLIFPLFNLSEGRTPRGDRYMSFVFGIAILFLLPKLIFCIFHLSEDIIFNIHKLFNKSDSGPKISRYKFITLIGGAIATIPFFGILYGIIKGKYDFEIIKKNIAFQALPSAFDGLRIVHISDMHLGSFPKHHPSVIKAIELINDLNADYIFFTGDIVNNFSYETEGWAEHFSKLKAQKGKFSVLGNHDYGDYSDWSSLDAKAQNFKEIKAFHKEIGFELLMNENRVFEKDGASIQLIGLENWGAGGFSKHGDLEKSYHGISEDPFTILLSHDPSHWDAQVLGKKDIDLTLAGHTHGMQFGVRLGKFQYSPVQHRYPRWSGLYKEGKQHLYVNKGFGFIGFPGRVGMPPEITCLTLKKA
ncbi:MAG: metallophosphoesterase [Flavobacteriales bacterium]|nr:metallophosphoesterase [Flavobacteriales bacterium]